MSHKKTRSFFLITFLGVVLCGAVRAQAPDTLSDVVFSFDAYSQFLDHDVFDVHWWLQANGNSVMLTNNVTHDGSLTSGVVQGGISIGPQLSGSGKWTYFKDSATTARIIFSDQDPNGALNYCALTFTTPTSGTIISLAGATPTVPGGLYGQGFFSIRPAQFGVGPVNLSTRTFLTGSGATIAGFVIPAGGTRWVLLRAVGPGLTAFSVTNTAAAMGLTIYNSAGPLSSATNWSATSLTTTMFQNLFTLCGAFPLTPGQTDACLAVELAPGAYTAQMTAATAGNALIEVYFLP
jgi:hypothetical protein